MLISEIQVPVTNLDGAGNAAAAQLKKLGIENIGQLLCFFPRDWEDRTVFSDFSNWNKAKKIYVLVTVLSHEWFGFGKMKTLKLIVKDCYGKTASLICFNRPFLQQAFPIGSQAAVYGSFHFSYGSLQSSDFELEKKGQIQQKLLPVYRLTAGLGQAKIRKLIQTALKKYARGIDSELPKEIITKYGLPEKEKLLFLLHNPEKQEDIEKGKYALIFEEFFFLQYSIGIHSIERRGTLPDITVCNENSEKESKQPVFTEKQQQLLARLPFKLTEDQLTAAAEINTNLDSINPMARLIQGDVGSGKTLIAFLACLKVIESGGQAAFLAPTELLARQHAENAAKLLEPLGIQIAFLTGNVKAKGRSSLLRELQQGSIGLLVGTHTLFSQGVRYSNLKLAVIDEQHRFGVLQRAAIIQKGTESNPEKIAPHILMMSATPIPRTLALSVFGDLDISTIKTMPEGRKPVITYVAGGINAEKVYHFIGQEILKGRQAYFVYPLIEESEKLSLKSASQMFEQLKENFPTCRLAIIHSKIDEEEQEKIMTDFKQGLIQILVATSVVEVGVDVPNASCIVIEHAERFGLAALHQLRGRVGRGNIQAYCFLIYGRDLTENAKKRLEIMKNTTDGFVIAEEDLKLRGPGDISGIEQSGYLGFKFADPIRDFKILQAARTAAFDFILSRKETLR